MREIKFRIWDNAPIKYGFNGIMINHEYAMQSDYLKDALNGKYQIMQYTGLKDREGTEIYEGDILKRVITFDGESREFIESVIFNGASFCTLDKDKTEHNTSSYLANFLGHKIEVIGNIHEHKHLLDASI